MAEGLSGTPKSTFNPILRSKLTTWLKKVQKGQLVNGDKRIQSECYKGFQSLSKKVDGLCREFEELMRVIRPIGSSSGLISTSKRLREGIKNVLGEFESNSAEIWREFSLGIGSIELPSELKDVSKHESQLPEKMYELSELLREFFNGLCDIPEFSDERLTDALLEFRQWLLFRADRIASQLYDRRFVGSSTARLYISQVMKEMESYVSAVESALADFVQAGVTSIREAQEKAQTRFQNMSTVATFLSAVTATTIPYSMSRERLKTVVLALWISSLILSLASAINSQLAMHWRAAMYRSPRSALPFWMSMCIDHVPLACLVAAMLAFSAGLVVWTIAAELELSVKVSAATLTGATFLVLLIVISWAGLEMLYNQDSERDPGDLQPLARAQAPHFVRQLEAQAKNITREEADQPRAESSSTEDAFWDVWQTILFITKRISHPESSHGQSRAIGHPVNGNEHGIGRSASRHGSSRAADLSESLNEDDGILTDEIPRVLPSTNSTEPARLKVQRGLMTAVHYFRAYGSDELHAIVWAQNSQPQDKLQTIQPVKRLPVLHPPGHDIRFSPDGKYFAASQSKGGVAIWDIDNFDGDAKKTIPSSGGRFAWSPSSTHFVIVEKKGLTIWQSDEWHGVSRRTGVVTNVAWLQSSSNFVAVTNNELHIYDTNLEVGQYEAIRDLPLLVHEVASLPQPHREENDPKDFILVLGTVRDELGDSTWTLTKTEVARPKSAEPECLLLAIELRPGKRWQNVAAAPILSKARHVCVSSDGKFALVSYRDGDPPELWRLRSQLGRVQLVFRGRYFIPKHSEARDNHGGVAGSTIFGKARFCGDFDRWVMATDGKSNIYIWDRASRQPLHALGEKQIRDKFKLYSSISTITSPRRSRQAGLVIASTCIEGGIIIWEEPAVSTESGSERVDAQ